MENINWGYFLGIVVLCISLGGVLTYGFFPRTVDSDGKLDTEGIAEAVEQAVKDKDAQIKLLQEQIAELGSENVTDLNEDEIDEEIIKITGYAMDEIYLSQLFNDTLSDREIKYLFDGEVEFDDKDYDAEEILTITDFELLANEDDFKGISYLTIPYEGITYEFVFENSLNTNEINEDETLKFNLLGKEVEVIDWDVDEITFTQGEEYFMNEGASVVVENKEVVLETVFDEKVYVKVDDESKRIREGEVAKINGLEVKVTEVLYSGYAGGSRMATLIIGGEVEYELIDGEEYEEDSIWEWSIDSNSIGLVLIEEFMEIDEDYNALAKGEMICLPDNYTCIQYNGIVEEDTEEYKFDLDSKSGKDYVRIKGNFISGIEDYDKIYINTTGIYDRDLNLIDSNNIDLGDTDLTLIVNLTHITINDFIVNFDLNWTNVEIDDVDYLTNYGILVENPEDSCDEKEFKITVPEEKVEATISID